MPLFAWIWTALTVTGLLVAALVLSVLLLAWVHGRIADQLVKAAHANSEGRHADAEKHLQAATNWSNWLPGTGWAYRDGPIAVGLARAYVGLGRDDDAMAQVKAALRYEATEHNLPLIDRADFLCGLGQLLESWEQPAEAEKRYRLALELREKSPGSDPRDWRVPAAFLAHLLLSQKRHQEAEPLLRRLVALDEGDKGSDPEEATALRMMLAILLGETGRRAEAEALLAGQAKSGPGPRGAS